MRASECVKRKFGVSMTETVPAALEKPQKRPVKHSVRRVVRRMGKVLLYLFLIPLVLHAAWWTWNNTAWSWRSARRRPFRRGSSTI